jgi:hypothetical protein
MKIDILHLKNDFLKSQGGDLFEFIIAKLNSSHTLGECVNTYVDVVNEFDDELDVTDNFGKFESIEYALVFPKNR